MMSYADLEQMLLAAVATRAQSVEGLVRLARENEAQTVRVVDVKIAAMNLVNKGQAQFTDEWTLAKKQG